MEGLLTIIMTLLAGLHLSKTRMETLSRNSAITIRVSRKTVIAMRLPNGNPRETFDVCLMEIIRIPAPRKEKKGIIIPTALHIIKQDGSTIVIILQFARLLPIAIIQTVVGRATDVYMGNVNRVIA
jgi:hypothetical protein